MWVRLDDGFTDHPKILAAGPLAGWLFVCGLTYCNRHQTDGFLPRNAVKRLADIPRIESHITRLVAVNLWEICDGGYRVHDYLEYQPAKAHMEKIRSVRAESGRRGGLQSGQQRAAKAKQLAEANAKQLAKQTGEAKTNPVPSRPVPSQEKETPVANAPGVASGALAQPARATRKPAKAADKTEPATTPRLSWIEKHPLFEVVCEVFGRPAPSQWSSLGQLLKDLTALGATPEEFRRRADNYPLVMGNDRDGRPIRRTLRAVANNWHLLDAVPIRESPRPHGNGNGRMTLTDKLAVMQQGAMVHDGTGFGTGNGPSVRPVAEPRYLLGHGADPAIDLPAHLRRVE